MQNGPRLSFRPTVEALEDRTLMAAQLTATLSGGVLRIDGTSADDVIAVRENSGRISVDNTPIHIAGGASVSSVKDAAVSKVLVYGYGGDDSITLGDSHMSSPQALHIPASVYGGDGNDVIHGGQANDLLDGGAGDDQIWGGGGNDLLRGYTGDDKLWGDDGNDRLEGSTGRNGLYGGAGDDTIISQSASDDIDGGYGRDTASIPAGRSPSTLRSIEVTNTQAAAQAIVAVAPKAPPPLQAAAPAPTTATVSLSAVVQKMINMINAYRVQNKLPALTIDARLTSAASYQASYMARTGHYDHTDLDGRTLVDRVVAAGYNFSFVAENIHLYDPANPRTLGIDKAYPPDQMANYFIDGWKVSAPHNENLLSKYPVSMGVALGRDSKGRVFADLVLGHPS